MRLPFASKNTETTSPNPHEVIETLRNSGLDPATIVVVGSGALAICGILAASDLDVIVSPEEHTRLYNRGKTPSGMLLYLRRDSHRATLRTEQPRPLHIDILRPRTTSADGRLLTADEVSASFKEEASAIPLYKGYRFASPEQVLAELVGSGRRKDRARIPVVNQYLAQASLVPQQRPPSE